MGCDASVGFFAEPAPEFSGIVVNDSDYKVEYTVSAVYGQCEVIRERFDPNPNRALPPRKSTNQDGEEVVEDAPEHERYYSYKESTTAFNQNVGIVIVPPHSKSSTGLTELVPGKHKINLSIETEGRTVLAMIKDVIITKASDMRLKIRKDKTIKNIMPVEFEHMVRETEYFEPKEEDVTKIASLPPKRGGISMGDAFGAGASLLGGAGDMLGKGKGMFGDAKGLMGDAKGMMNAGKGIMGDAKGIMGDAKGLVGDAKGIYGDAKGMVGDAKNLGNKGKGLLDSFS